MIFISAEKWQHLPQLSVVVVVVVFAMELDSTGIVVVIVPSTVSQACFVNIHMKCNVRQQTGIANQKKC